MRLKRKQQLDNHTWQEATDTIENVVPPEDLDNLIDQTVDEIKATARSQKVGVAWSGGKDSIALGYVMQQAGQFPSVLVHTNLEYPDFLPWVQKNKPDGLQLINTGQDYEWLRNHPDMLFPQGKKGAQWFPIVQHKGQAKFFKDNQLDVIALGRRTQDGNYTGPKGQNIYTNSKGITRWSPIAHWKHEHIIALLKYKNLDLPPIYSAPRGFIVGTGAWPARQGTSTDPNSDQYGWAEMWNYHPDTVREAAQERIPGAAEYIERITNG